MRLKFVPWKMKATGEVMAIGRTFESSFKKALTSIESKYTGLMHGRHLECSEEEVKALLHVQDDRPLGFKTMEHRVFHQRLKNHLGQAFLQQFFPHPMKLSQILYFVAEDSIQCSLSGIELGIPEGAQCIIPWGLCSV